MTLALAARDGAHRARRLGGRAEPAPRARDRVARSRRSRIARARVGSAVIVGTGFTGRVHARAAAAVVEHGRRRTCGRCAGSSAATRSSSTASSCRCATPTAGRRPTDRDPRARRGERREGPRVARDVGDGVMAMGEPQGGLRVVGVRLRRDRARARGGSHVAACRRRARAPRSRSCTTSPTRSHPPRSTPCRAARSGGRRSRRCRSNGATSRCTRATASRPTRASCPYLRPELGAGTLTGSPEQVRERLEALEAAGVTEFVYAPMGADVAHELEAMARVAGLTPG